jgi:hypothetical protein
MLWICCNRIGGSKHQVLHKIILVLVLVTQGQHIMEIINCNLQRRLPEVNDDLKDCIAGHSSN